MISQYPDVWYPRFSIPLRGEGGGERGLLKYNSVISPSVQ